MNKCKICGSWTPEGKEMCWLCEHTHRLPEMMKDPDKDIDAPAEPECEACRIPEPEKQK